MFAIFSLLFIITLSVIIVRIGAVALELTGLSPDIASFQAQSAFSGVGFTTSESEAIVTHPARRRILRTIIMLGSAGITTSMASLVLAFMSKDQKSSLTKIGVLALGIILILIFTRSRHIYKLMEVVIKKVLKRYTTLYIYDYKQLFGLDEGYEIAKLSVEKDSPLSGKPIRDFKKELEEMLILAIYRKIGRTRHMIGAPGGDTVIKDGDELICYAKKEVIQKNILHPA